ISAVNIPTLISDWAPNVSTHRLTMGYDRRRHGLVITLVTLSTGVNTCYWFDLRTRGFFPESYTTNASPYSMHYYEAQDPDFRHLFLGGRDGLIRQFDDLTKNDAVNAAETEAINAYFTIGPVAIGVDRDSRGKLTSLSITTGNDTDGLEWQLYAADAAEDVSDNMASETSDISGTISVAGRVKLKPRVRGIYLGLRLENSTLGKTFSIENIVGTIKPAGTPP
ncbi:hypothetical protein LCGC14_2969570, partial [marine sediment metagenome]